MLIPLIKIVYAMPLVSVKLPENTKLRVARLAVDHGTTAHAVMVQAIESAVQSAEEYDAFVDDALRARDAAYQTGKVYDGPEFAAYIRAMARGEKVTKPRLKSLKSYVTPQAA
jgi:predicted transcriptional regulator